MVTQCIIRSYYMTGSGNDDRYNQGEIPQMVQASVVTSIGAGADTLTLSFYGPDDKERDSIPLSIRDARTFAANIISMIDVAEKENPHEN